MPCSFLCISFLVFGLQLCHCHQVTHNGHYGCANSAHSIWFLFSIQSEYFLESILPSFHSYAVLPSTAESLIYYFIKSLLFSYKVTVEYIVDYFRYIFQLAIFFNHVTALIYWLVTFLPFIFKNSKCWGHLQVHFMWLYFPLVLFRRHLRYYVSKGHFVLNTLNF